MANNPKRERKSKLQHDYLPEKIFLLDGGVTKPSNKAQPLSGPKDPTIVPPTSGSPNHRDVKTTVAVKTSNEGQRSGSIGSSPRPCILWFHTQDLRLRDNPALYAAFKDGSPVIPLFIWAPHEEGELSIGGAAKVFLLESLKALQQSLALRFRLKLVFRVALFPHGALNVLEDIIDECGAIAVYANRQYEPAVLKRDDAIARRMASRGIPFSLTNASLLWQPWDVPVPHATQPRGHFGTLMSFMRPALATGNPEKPVPIPASLTAPTYYPTSLAIEELGLYRAPVRRKADGGMEVIDWAEPIIRSWKFGEEAALQLLEAFIQKGLPDYEKARGRADIETAVSRLSPYIHFGILSVREMYWKVKQALKVVSSPTFSRRLVWRDLAYWQLYLFPDMPTKSMRAHYEALKWNDDPERLKAWQKGMTGYPLVDAGMRELWQTGWMHQNVRMVTALFLVEYLGIHWIEGLKWYHDTLVDADLAINSMMWQNGGGSGLDHWNFSIHPVNHAKFCDPDGKYVRKWIPELRALPNAFVHQPWAAPLVTLQQAGVTLGVNYPHRILVDLAGSRAKTIQWFVDMKRAAGPSKCDERGYDIVTLYNGDKVRVYTKPEYRVTFQPNSGVSSTPSRRSGKNGARPNHRDSKPRYKSDEGTAMSEFTACLQESMSSYRGR